ncbi:MAG: hypothetical protein NT031_02805 [Planctomycetota bacterium]|nr:hypothetical protein [Planctomycetota bacterium]
MSVRTFATRRWGWVWAINVLFFLVMLAAQTMNDGNGRYPGLNEASSRAVLIAVYICAFVTDGVAGIFDKNGSRRAIAVGFAIVYVLTLIPFLIS